MAFVSGANQAPAFERLFPLEWQLPGLRSLEPIALRRLTVTDDE
jgi:hypothetical protein